jgi:hypothetical protein
MLRNLRKKGSIASKGGNIGWAYGLGSRKKVVGETYICPGLLI